MLLEFTSTYFPVVSISERKKNHVSLRGIMALQWFGIAYDVAYVNVYVNWCSEKKILSLKAEILTNF